MNRKISMLRKVILFSSILIGFGVGAQERINWEPGTVFTFAQQDAWKKEVSRWDINVVSRDGDNFSVIEKNGDRETPVKVTNAGVYTRPMPKSTESFEYTPIKLPLAEGVEWEWVYYYLGSNTGEKSMASNKCEAKSMEEVEVSAGKFNAWKIVCRGSWNSMAGSSGSNNRTVWYAPSISSMVKTDGRTSYFGGSEQYFISLIKVSKP